MLPRWHCAAAQGARPFAAVHPSVHLLTGSHRISPCKAARKAAVEHSDPQLPPRASSSSSSGAAGEQPPASTRGRPRKGSPAAKTGSTPASKAGPPVDLTCTSGGPAPGGIARNRHDAARKPTAATSSDPAAGKTAVAEPAQQSAPGQRQPRQPQRRQPPQQQQQTPPRQQQKQQQQQQQQQEDHTPSATTGTPQWWRQKELRIKQLLVNADPATDIPSLADTLVSDLDDVATAFKLLVLASYSDVSSVPRWERTQPDPYSLELATALAVRLEGSPVLDSARSGMLASILSGMGRLGVPNPGLMARLETLSLAKLPGASAAQLIRFGESMMAWGYSVSPQWALTFLAAVESLLSAAGSSPPQPKRAPKGKGAKAAAKAAPAAAGPLLVEHLLTFAAFAAWWGGGYSGAHPARGIAGAEAGGTWAGTHPAAAAAASDLAPGAWPPHAAGAAAAAVADRRPSDALPLLFATAAADVAPRVEPHLYPALLAGAGAIVQLCQSAQGDSSTNSSSSSSSSSDGGGAIELHGLLRELLDCFLLGLAQYRAVPLAQALEALLSWPLDLQQQLVAPRLQAAPEELLLQIQIQLPHGRAPQVVTYLRAVAAWGLQPEEAWLEAILERSHAMLPVCSACELTDLAVALQQLQLRPYRAWWQDYYQRALIEVPSMTASQLVSTLQAFSSIGIVFDPSLLHAFVEGLQLHLGTMEAPQLQGAVQALRRMYPKVLPGRTVQLLVEEMERRRVFQGASR